MEGGRRGASAARSGGRGAARGGSRAKAPARQDGRRSDLRGTARERLLDAAEHVFAEHGFRGASVDDVAARAGVTKGAFYWNFASKQELFFALLDERVDRRVRDVLGRAEAAGGEDETIPATGRDIVEVADAERQIVLLMQEYWALAARDDQSRDRYVQRQRDLREAIARALGARHEATGVTPAMDLDRLATAVQALGYGLAIERIVDPDAVPDDLLGELLGVIYDGLAARAAAAGS